MFKFLKISKNKIPFLISPFLLNNQLKFNFSLARLFEHRYYVKVMNNEDIDELKKNYIKKIEEADNVHVDIRDNNMEKMKFKELFDTLAKVKKEEIHLDLSNTKMDDEKIDSLTKCFESWNLKNLDLHISNVDLTNKQFDHLMNSIEKMKNLKMLNLQMENVNLNRSKRSKMESVVNNLPNLTHVSIDVRNNNLSEEDAANISRMLDRFDVRHFFF